MEKDTVKGKIEEGVGRMTGDDERIAEGQADQAKGKAKDAAEHVRDAGSSAKDAVRDATR